MNKWIIVLLIITGYACSTSKRLKKEVSVGCGIKAIPYLVLIDPDRVTIGKNLPGAALHKA